MIRSDAINLRPLAMLDDVQMHNRTPDHRWLMAGCIAKDPKIKTNDSMVRQVASYCRAVKNDKMTEKLQHIHRLVLFYENGDGPKPRWYVEALLLGGAGDDEISSVIGLSPSFIKDYHDLFYDVRPVRHLTLHVESACMRRITGFAIYDTMWKRIAYENGIDAIISLWSGKGTEEADKEIDQRIVRNMRFSALVASEERNINPYNQGEVIEQYVSMNQKEKLIDKIASPAQLEGMQLTLARRTMAAIESINVPEALLIKRLQGAVENPAGNR